jgi:virginiamycin A acetyltransferase
MRETAKFVARWLFILLLLPFAILCAFGHVRPLFTIFAHFCALLPGIPGDYARAAFYWMTLRDCAIDSRISFGTFFAHPEASVGSKTYIGAYCVLGRTRIGAHTQIASHVQILSGRRQHARDEAGDILSADWDSFVEVTIGENCWIGAGAIVMADVGEGTTIGAGSIVVDPVPAKVIAVGNPARVVRQV